MKHIETIGAGGMETIGAPMGGGTGSGGYNPPDGGIPKTDLASDVQSTLDNIPSEAGSPGQVLQLDANGNPVWANPAEGSLVDTAMSDESTNPVQNKVIKEYIDDVANRAGDVPTSMSLDYPSWLTLGNVNKHKIKVSLEPSTAMKNVIFVSDNDAVKVSPDGTVSALRKGSSEVHVIPIFNTSLSRTIRINVSDAVVRLAGTRLRITDSGAIRLK